MQGKSKFHIQMVDKGFLTEQGILERLGRGGKGMKRALFSKYEM